MVWTQIGIEHVQLIRDQKKSEITHSLATSLSAQEKKYRCVQFRILLIKTRTRLTSSGCILICSFLLFPVYPGRLWCWIVHMGKKKQNGKLVHQQCEQRSWVKVVCFQLFHRIIKPSFKWYICDVILNLYELDTPWITVVSQDLVIEEQNGDYGEI